MKKLTVFRVVLIDKGAEVVVVLYKDGLASKLKMFYARSIFGVVYNDHLERAKMYADMLRDDYGLDLYEVEELK